MTREERKAVPAGEPASDARLRALDRLLAERGLAARAEGAISRRRGRGPWPLSFAQERLWFLESLHPGQGVYTVPAAVRLEGSLELRGLALALGSVVARHEALRTRFVVVEGRPRQAVDPPRPVPLPVVDLRRLDPERRESAVEALAAAEARRGFDLERGPLLRATLVRLDREEHSLLLSTHHIVSDNRSAAVLVRDLVAAYAAPGVAPEGVPELPVQYADFAVWQRDHLAGDRLETELADWRERLAGAPAVLDLPVDRPRPPVPGFRGAAVADTFPPALADSARRLAEGSGGTLFMVLLTAFSALVERLAGRRDQVVGVPVAGRERVEVEELVGFFVNTLAVRLEASPEASFDALLADVRQRLVDAFAHQELPVDSLIQELLPERRLDRTPLFQVVFQKLEAPPEEVVLPGLRARGEPLPVTTSKFDLVVNVAERGDGLHLSWRYDSDLFEATTVRRWARAFRCLVEAAAEDPATPVCHLPSLAPPERHQLLVEWAETRIAPVPAPSLWALFEASFRASPDAVALTAGGEHLSYGALRQRAAALARRLRGAGAGPEVPVGLRLERSPDLVAAVLGTLGAGAAYVPLDPAWPEERVRMVVEDTGLRLVVTDRGERLPGGAELVQVAPRAEADGPGGAGPPGPEPLGSHPAYVLYTSGSTGRPKGVVVTHANVLRLLAATRHWLRPASSDAWTLFHSYAFDFSVWEIWGALGSGGRLVVVPHGVSRSPDGFRHLLARERVTVLNQTPSAFRQLSVADGRWPGELALRLVVFGGEALDPGSLVPWWRRHGDRRPTLVNMYGITETTVHVTARPLTEADAQRGSVIGPPVADLAVRVLDPLLRPCPLGVLGELAVSGPGLARGYLGRPAQTAARFVPDPAGVIPGGRLYRSGDLARWLPGRDLEFLGRMDHQVKVRGFRIELGEVESALASHPELREAVVAARPLPSGETGLVAYAVPAAGAAPSLKAVRAHAAKRLPDYMLPGALVVLERLPLTASGKLDRRALPDPEAPAPSAAPAGGSPPAAEPSELERLLARLWAEVLGTEGIDPDAEFFDLGGDSISAAVLANRLQQELGEIVHVVAVFDAPTVRAMAAYLEEQHSRAVARRLGFDGPGRRKPEDSRQEPPLDAAAVERFRALVPTFDEVGPPEVRNPPVVFLLAPPRSGTTLLRVMLAGHPGLFAPPELELLGFRTLAERREAFPGRDRFWLEGAVRAVMELEGCGADQAEARIEEMERGGATTADLYARLQAAAGEALLVDKTPSYALDLQVLRRAEALFEGPLYIHLRRDPRAVVRSFEEAKLDQLFFRRDHPFSRRQLAELVWTVSHQNLLALRSEVPADRWATVWFEELVEEPVGVLRRLCTFLGLDYDSAMADPYGGGSRRMTDGPHDASRMLGDVKFHQYGSVDPRPAARWRETEDRAAPPGEPTRELAEALGYRDDTELDPIEPLVSRGVSTFPLAPAQERLWLLDQMFPGSPVYNLAGAVLLAGRLDASRLAAAVRGMVRRHAILRTTYRLDRSRPVQELEEPATAAGRCAWRVVDLSALPGDRRHAEARRAAACERDRPFRLRELPLLRSTLLRLGDEEHVALFVTHHIAADGWSVGLLVRDLAAEYRRRLTGEPRPRAGTEALQYADFAAWQSRRFDSSGFRVRLARRRKHLAGAPELRLPTDRPRPPVVTGRGGRIRSRLAAGLGPHLEVLARRVEATPFMVLLATFGVLLSRYASQDDVVVGSPVAGRTRTETETMLGCFVNTLVLRLDLSGVPTFEQLLARIRSVVLDAFADQEVPFERLVDELQPERDAGRQPLCQVVLAYQNAPREAFALPGLDVAPFELPGATAKFDLSLMVAETGEGMEAAIEYARDLFDASTVERITAHLNRLLSAGVEDPSRRIAELPLLSPAEARELLAVGTGPPAPPAPGDLAERILERAAAVPDAVALVSGERTFSYGEVLRRAQALAGRLERLGVGPESVVGVHFGRGPDFLVASLAVLLAKGAYLPLDPAYPGARLAFMTADAGARVVVIGAESPAWLPADGPPVVRYPGAREPEPAAASRRAPEPGALAYVIYTSGSTGTPKGVGVSRRSLTGLVECHRIRLSLTAEDRMAQTASPGFDASNLETWPSLVAGATVLFAPDEARLDPVRTASWLERERAVYGYLPTALVERLIAVGGPSGGALKLLYTGGDRLHRRPPPGCPWRLVNDYGPTETTVIATAADVAPAQASSRLPSIGTPLAGMTVRILDPRGRRVPVGVPSELHLGGARVGRGYLGRPTLTAERFLPDRFASVPGARAYRTGDLGRWLPEGEIEFLGRADRQVQIRGFRIEPAEVEGVLASHPAVRDVAVAPWGDSDEDRHLAAWVVPRDGASWRPDELRAHAAGRLPGFMVPATIVRLRDLPLTANGKPDRSRLPAPDASRDPSRRRVAPRDELEGDLVAIWSEVLKVDARRIGVEDGFFELGGHSLLATQVVSRILERHRVELPLRAVFETPTVSGMAARLRELEPVAPSDAAATGGIERIERGSGGADDLLAELEGLSDDEVRAALEGKGT